MENSIEINLLRKLEDVQTEIYDHVRNLRSEIRVSDQSREELNDTKTAATLCFNAALSIDKAITKLMMAAQI